MTALSFVHFVPSLENFKIHLYDGMHNKRAGCRTAAPAIGDLSIDLTNECCDSLTGVRSSGPNATSDLCTAASAAASLAGVYNGKLTISSECFDVVTGGFNLGRLSLVGCLAD